MPNFSPPISPASPWLNEKAVAAITGLSVHTLRAHRQHHRGIPYAKVGRAVRYSASEVQAYMNSRQVQFHNNPLEVKNVKS